MVCLPVKICGRIEGGFERCSRGKIVWIARKDEGWEWEGGWGKGEESA